MRLKKIFADALEWIADVLDLSISLPESSRQLSLLYATKLNEHASSRTLRRIREAWLARSSIELIVWSAERNWRKLYYACKNAPPEHSMRIESINYLYAMSDSQLKRTQAKDLLGRDQFLLRQPEEDDQSESWKYK